MENDPSCCFFCGRSLPDGAGRLVLFEHAMCLLCENILVNTRAEDEMYRLFKEKIKQIWFK